MQQDRSSQEQPASEPKSAFTRQQRDGGYLLLAILLMMALMIIAATIVAPRVVQQIKRDREEEMIHRGTEYARAIKKYYKKFGSYPSTLEQLDTTNQIRFLRKRYKDPLTKDGKWKLLNYGDIATLLNAAAPGTPAAALAAQNGLSHGGALTANGGASASASSAQQQQSGLFGSGSRRRLRREIRIQTSFIRRTQIIRALVSRLARQIADKVKAAASKVVRSSGRAAPAHPVAIPTVPAVPRVIHPLRKTRPAVLKPLAAEQSWVSPA